MDKEIGDPKVLWTRLQQFEFDEQQADVTFSRRLQLENGWTRAFTLRAIEEYRRFVLLAMTGEEPVTPSDQVDQVWHLHLCYTRSYWEQMCGEVLGRPLHHGPTKGGSSQRALFFRQYERTLEHYRAFFGHEAPADIWPPSAVRFAPRRWQRVDASATMMLPRAAVTAAAALVPTVLLVGACTASGSEETYLGVAVGIFAVGLFVWCFVRLARGNGGGPDGSGMGGGGCGGGHHHHDDGGGGDGCGGGGCGGGGCGGGCGS